jgi:hypothetical protein
LLKTEKLSIRPSSEGQHGGCCRLNINNPFD